MRDRDGTGKGEKKDTYDHLSRTRVDALSDRAVHAFADDLHYDILVDHLSATAIVRAQDCLLVRDDFRLKYVGMVGRWGGSG